MSDVTPRPGPGYPRFFGELSTRMGDVRRADRRRYLQFFAELSPRLDTAKALERELDRQLARRFNVFDYLSTAEVGLSSIIADLLNPEARHGQGTLFLRTLLDELTEIRHRPDLDTNFTKRISVVTERVITNKRRLDISVEIPGSDGTYCLAIENKPYADDQPNQVKDYLAFLQREYADRFLLIYLSPTGQGPSRWSLPCENWTSGRAALPSWLTGARPMALTRKSRLRRIASRVSGRAFPGGLVLSLPPRMRARPPSMVSQRGRSILSTPIWRTLDGN